MHKDESIKCCLTTNPTIYWNIVDLYAVKLVDHYS